MNTRQTKLLLLLPGGRMASAGLIILLAFSSFTAHAQTQGGDASGMRALHDRNRRLGICTWSMYAEGGLSWATGVWYPDLDGRRSYRQAPAVGGGVDFTIRPWVRVGAEYLWSRYRREQRFSALDTKTMPVKAYGNYLMNFHNAKFSASFNLMELWPGRRAQWFNIWVGTGVGCTFARGNEYGIWFSNTLTQDGKTVPLVDGTSVSSDGAVTITGSVRMTNRHEMFNTPYIPASIHIEADVNRQLTIGLKGEMDWLISHKDLVPKNFVFALVTVRYNFASICARL